MTHTNRTGRQLDVDAIVQSKNKVTLGFKCEPQLKMDLAIEAQKYSMSLSEYVEVLLAQRHNQKGSGSDKTEIERLNIELDAFSKELSDVSEELHFYENAILRKAFEKNAGKSISYVTANGVEKVVVIRELKDVYTVLIETAKLS